MNKDSINFEHSNSQNTSGLEGSGGLTAAYDSKTFLDKKSKELIWQKWVAKTRIDAFSFTELQTWIEEQRIQGHKCFAIDLKATHFMGIAAIYYFQNLSHTLKKEGGALAMLSMNGRVSRMFEIYGHSRDVYKVDREQDLDPILKLLKDPYYQLAKVHV